MLFWGLELKIIAVQLVWAIGCLIVTGIAKEKREKKELEEYKEA